MFVTDKKLAVVIAEQNREIAMLTQRYWQLYHKHDLLLEHLGLTETLIPAKTELRARVGKKGKR